MKYKSAIVAALNSDILKHLFDVSTLRIAPGNLWLRYINTCKT